ncbi:TPA: hypothetical protein DCR49_02935 [Candidatus Delongbacteria bacterium]|nr:hypothetical protein [Candidatus Delongbacteria bacterium]
MNSSMKDTAGRIEKLFKEDKRFFVFYADLIREYGNQDRALKILKDNINLFTDYSTGELVLGEMFFNQRKFDQAEMLFKGALKKDKTCVKAMKYLSVLEEAKGNKAAQIDILNELLKYDPFDQDAKNFIRMNVPATAAPEIIPETPEKEIKHSAPEPLKEGQAFDPDEYFSKINSSDDIQVPEISFETAEENFKKHKFSEEVLNKEKSFSEDITESLDSLTKSFITESKAAEDKAKLTDYSDIIKVKPEVKNELDLNYQDKDPKIAKILSELNLPSKEYKEKMMALSEYLSEDPEDYERQVNFARAKFKFAAASIKKELQYYSKKIKEEPKNEKYNQIMKTYREELLKLDKDLIEDLNRLKNLYY